MDGNQKQFFGDTRADIIIEGPFRYIILNNNEAALLSVYRGYTESTITIPSATENNIPVVEILNGAFQDSLTLETINIPASIRIIHAKAFYQALNLKMLILM